MTNVLTLWDCEREADVAGEQLAYWSFGGLAGGALSIPLLVEEGYRELRDDFLDWSDRLAEFPFDGGPLAAYLRDNSGESVSYWWMSAIAERSPMCSPRLFDVLKLRALEKQYLDRGYEGLRYIGDDDVLIEVLAGWCDAMGHPFEAINGELGEPAPVRRRGLFSLYQKLPQLLQGVVYWGRFAVTRWLWAAISSPREGALAEDGESVIVTYFPGIDLKAAKEGRFRSHYWGPLHSLLEEVDAKVNWIWLYSKSPQLSYREGARLRTSFDRRAAKEGGQRFSLLEDSLSLTGLIAAFVRYLSRYRRGRKLIGFRAPFCFEGSQLNFFPVLAQEWNGSLLGSGAMSACLYEEAFEQLMKRLPASTKRLYYLFENVFWEQALLRAWRVRGEGYSLGVLHTPAVTAAMNFRGYAVPSSQSDVPWGKSLPDAIGVPGEVFRKRMIEHGWPEQMLVPLEALRYLGLFASRLGHRTLPTQGRRLLVITGYMPEESESQLRLLARAAERGALGSYGEVLIKPHPDCPVEGILDRLAPDFPYVVEHSSLTELWGGADVAYTANSTSAAIEAVVHGLPLVITGALGAINLNPLLDFPGVSFASTAEELGERLMEPATVDDSDGFFYHDEELPQWRGCLGRS